jgi:putative addiction module component (TIGR02574 family)
MEKRAPSKREIAEAWKVEMARRVRDYESGKSKSIPAEEVFRKLSQKYKK